MKTNPKHSDKQESEKPREVLRESGQISFKEALKKAIVPVKKKKK